MYFKSKKPRNFIMVYNWKVFDKIEAKIGEEKTDKISEAVQSIINWTWNYFRLAHKETPKSKIVIHPWDTWSVDHTLAEIIEPLLKKLKEVQHGAPYVDDEDVPNELKSTAAKTLTEQEKEQGYPDNNHHKRWEWILDEMIWAFEQKNLDWEDQYHAGETFDKENHKKHHERMENGFRLFGKYYQALWD